MARHKKGSGWLALLLVAALAALFTSGSDDRPSLLLVSIDTLRADRLSVYGFERPTTPRLEEFASSAIVYERAFAPAPFTMPSVASLLTGCYPDRLGLVTHSRSSRLSPDFPVLAELADGAGYQTAAVVANPWLANHRTGFSRGFDIYSTGRDNPPGSRFNATEVTNAAIEALPFEASGPPFVLWVHYIDTHMPYRPEPAYLRRLGYETADSAIVEDFVLRRRQPQEIYFGIASYDRRTVEATRNLYDAAILYVDQEVGRLLDVLDRRGLSSSTIVAIVSDHGESLGDHGLFFAHDFTLYDELLRVPLLLRLPSAPSGRVRQEVMITDLLPTLCEHMKLACQHQMDGRVLPNQPENSDGAARVLFAASAPARRRYDANPRQYLGGLHGRWTMALEGYRKLIRIPHPDADVYEAYDTARDPQETINLYSSGRFEDLRHALHDWEKRMER
ncbi:MAG: sulfatase, partial [Candidatus Binatia bacterium]